MSKEEQGRLMDSIAGAMQGVPDEIVQMLTASGTAAGRAARSSSPKAGGRTERSASSELRSLLGERKAELKDWLWGRQLADVLQACAPHGVPVTLKINVDVAGRPTTNGVAAFQVRKPTW